MGLEINLEHLNPAHIVEGIVNAVIKGAKSKSIKIDSKEFKDHLMEIYDIYIHKNKDISEESKKRVTKEMGNLFLKGGNFKMAEHFYNIAGDEEACKEISVIYK